MRRLGDGWVVGALALLVGAFVALVGWYGDAWLVPWHDEVVIGRLAHNWATGAGFRNDWVDGLLPGADRRTYWQMPAYPFALALWGKGVGFDLNALRALSRCLGAVALVLLFALGRQLGLTPTGCLLTALWTASDLHFQFASNFVRPEALCTVALLASANAVATAMRCSDRPTVRDGFWLLAGTAMAVAVLTHPLALAPSVVLLLVAARQARWRGVSAFAAPLLAAIGAWLCYALQDPATFAAQMRAHWWHKRRGVVDAFLLLVSGANAWGIQAYLGVPLLPLPAAGVVLLTGYAAWRRQLRAPRWLIAFAFALYAAVSAGGEAWYPAVFVPMGYLLVTLLAHDLLCARPQWRRMVLVAAVAWWGVQVAMVARHAAAVPRIRTEVGALVTALAHQLPPRAVLLVGSFSPDPTFALQQVRPDVRVYALMPPPMVDRAALQRLQRRLTHALLLVPPPPLLAGCGKPVRQWQFTFGGLSAPDQGICIALFRCPTPPCQGAYNSGRSR